MGELDAKSISFLLSLILSSPQRYRWQRPEAAVGGSSGVVHWIFFKTGSLT